MTPKRSDLIGRVWPIAAALAAALVLSLPATLLAQDDVESPPRKTAPSGIDFPVMLGGQLLTAETFTGPEWLARFSEGESEDLAFVEGTQALIEGAGKTVDDLTVKTALYRPVVDADPLGEPVYGEPAVVAAFRIDDTEARTFVEDAIHLMLGDIAMPDLVMRPLDDKWVIRVVDAERPGVYPRTVYLLDDTAWIIEGDEAIVWDALDQLDDPAPVGTLAGDSLASDVPVVLDGRRRVELYEGTEPLFLPMLRERLGSEVDDWLVDLYLDAGVSPGEMLGVGASWSLAQDSLQIEAYRLPAAAAELTERLRRDIFLGAGLDQEAFAGLLEGVAVIEQEVGGRDVSTLDYGTVKQHVIAGEDTIWVVTDYAGETEMAEEAIAALP